MRNDINPFHERVYPVIKTGQERMETVTGPEEVKATVRDGQEQMVISINLIRYELEESNKRGVRNHISSSGLGNGKRHQKGEDRAETNQMVNLCWSICFHGFRGTINLLIQTKRSRYMEII
jgi:hypothetical protein